MSVITPSKKYDISKLEHKDAVSEDYLRRLAANINFFESLMPPGAIIVVQVNLGGVPAINSDVWQVCDGSQINNSNSPFYGGNTPNLLGKIVKGASTTTSNPSTAGNNVFDFSHDHGGQTGFQTPRGDSLIRFGSERRPRIDHGHSIQSDLGSVTIDYPACINFVPYMKIV